MEKILQEPIWIGPRPLNGSKYIIIPSIIGELYHMDEITRPEMKLINILISRYGWKSITPPSLSNSELAEIYQHTEKAVKKETIEVMLSRLKKKGIIKIENEGKLRRIRIPSLEDILKIQLP